MGKTRKKRDRKAFPVTESASGYTKRVNAVEESCNDESKEELLQKIIRQLQDGETKRYVSLAFIRNLHRVHSSSLPRVARVRSSELRRPYLVPRCVLVARRRRGLQARPPIRTGAQARAARWPTYGVAQGSEFTYSYSPL